MTPRAKKNRGGRPSDFTPELKERLFAGIRACLTISKACTAAGITRSTLSRWLERGQKDYESGEFDTPYASFYDGYNRAQAEAEKHHAEIIAKVAAGHIKQRETKNVVKSVMNPEGDLTPVETVTTTYTRSSLPDWRASAFILERRFPEEWGPKKQVEITHRGTMSFTADDAAAAEAELNEWDKQFTMDVDSSVEK